MHESMVIELVKLYKIVSAAVKPYMPVVLINKDGVRIRAGEIEIGLDCETDLEDKAIILDKKTMDKLANAKGTVQFEPNGWVCDNVVCKTEWQYYKGPLEPIWTSDTKVINALDFKRGIDSVKVAVAKETARPILNYIQFKDSTLVGVDGYRIFTYKLLEDVISNEALIPKAVYEVLSKKINKNDESLVYGSAPYSYFFKYGNISIKAIKPSGEYLKWSSVFSDSYSEIEFDVHPQELYKLCEQINREKAVLDLKDDTGRPIKVIISKLLKLAFYEDGEYLKAEMHAPEHDTQIVDEFKIELIKGTKKRTDSIDIAFNPKYVAEALKPVAKEDSVRISLISNLTPMIIAGKQVKNLVLPIRIH